MSIEDTVKRCEKYLVGGHGVNQGATKTIASPMVSIFLGDEAEKFEDLVTGIYRNTWLQGADAMLHINSSSYSAAEEENIRLAAMEQGIKYADRGTVYFMYYWDISDGRFEDFFREITKAAGRGDGRWNIVRYLFIFFRQARQGESEVSKEHVNRIIAVMEEMNNTHVVLLGNVTADKTILEKNIAENYRLAADMAVVINSRDKWGNRLSSDLAFSLERVPVLSAGYHSESRPIEDIVRVSLGSLLDKYRRLSENAEETSLAQSIEAKYGGYTALFDDIYAKYLKNFLPGNTAFLHYVPYTREVEALDRSSAFHAALNAERRGGNRRGGIFGGVFGRKSADSAAPFQGTGQNRGILVQNAVKSLGSFWDTMMKMYYTGPVSGWLDGRSEGRNGREIIREVLENEAASTLTYKQMRDTGIRGEAEALSKMTEEMVRTELLSNTRFDSPDFAECLGKEAEIETKTRIYTELYHMLGGFIIDYSQNSADFSKLLDSVYNELGAREAEESVRDAYENLVNRDTIGHENEIRAGIRPCRTEDELLGQLERLFGALARGEEVYRYTFPEELNWRIGTVNQAKITDIIQKCFAYKVEDSGRVGQVLGTPKDGFACSIMSTPGRIMQEIDEKQMNVGEIFEVPRSDYIERLYVYAVNPDDIAW